MTSARPGGRGARPVPPVLARPGGGPLLLAHRGFSRDGRENTLAAFVAATELGADVVETDVRATADGVAVVLHDERLDRTTDGSGEVARRPWSEVARLRVGGREPLPRLVDVLGQLPSVRLNLDVKAAGAVRPVARALEEAGAWDRVVVASFSEVRRRGVLRAAPPGTAASGGAPVAAAVVAAVRARLPGPARRRAVAAALRGVDVLQVPVGVATPAFVRAVHEAGRRVHVWTVDDVPTAERLLDAGVDGLVTDRTDLLVDLVHGRAADGGRA